jgi:hypothetical protein
MKYELGTPSHLLDLSHSCQRTYQVLSGQADIFGEGQNSYPILRASNKILHLHIFLSAGGRPGLRKLSKKNKETLPSPRTLKTQKKTKAKNAKDGNEIVAETPLSSYTNDFAANNNDVEATVHRIGEISETSLHAALKHALAKPGDRFEVKVDGKIVDLLRANGEIVEVQTGNFGKLKAKIDHLAFNHSIRVVYPIAIKRMIVQLDVKSGEELSRRKSPKKGNIYSIFDELIHFPTLLSYPGISLEVFFVEIEELRVRDGKGSWRRKFQSILDKRLSSHEKSHVFSSTADLLQLLPESLPPEFTASLLAKEAQISVHLAREMAYVLKKNGLTREEGRRGREILYRLAKKRRSEKKPKPVKTAGP